ncbi:Cell wall beta-glucan synthesis [Penicillium italicum]|uniref:Cell wall beta-glucan synthesis n=1 Tax=Penicillium italicum TaxID=40296 RepID=A0A0A2KAB0_PENIT|nr:Cell wall beta-glucan synthesis [Penicillium italicum]
MRFFFSLAVAAMAAVASADNKANPFSIPTDGYTFTVGKPTALKWQPTTPGTVSLILQWGAVLSGNTGTVIAANLDNDGSYTWDVPSKLAAEPDYTIKIVSDSDSNDFNYIGRFTVDGSTVSVSSSSASSSTSATSSSSTDSSTSATGTTTSGTSTSSSSAITTTGSTTGFTTGSTTLTTASSTVASTSVSATETSETSSTAASTSTSATSSAATQSAVPTTNAGIANRVSGGMLALVAGALML